MGLPAQGHAGEGGGAQGCTGTLLLQPGRAHTPHVGQNRGQRQDRQDHICIKKARCRVDDKGNRAAGQDRGRDPAGDGCSFSDIEKGRDHGEAPQDRPQPDGGLVEGKPEAGQKMFPDQISKGRQTERECVPCLPVMGPGPDHGIPVAVHVPGSRVRPGHFLRLAQIKIGIHLGKIWIPGFILEILLVRINDRRQVVSRRPDQKGQRKHSQECQPLEQDVFQYMHRMW